MGKAQDHITRLSKGYRGSIEDLERAISLLIGKPDFEEAIKKVRPALERNVVRVFFSYKKKDEDAAKKIMMLLQDNSNERLEITSMAEFTKKISGKEWRETIRELTRGAQWFILLFPDSHDDWEWCIYETGLFEGHSTSADRLICLHHPDIRIPGPIEDYHAVPATIPDVEDFLHMVYLEDDPVPGMKALHKSIKSGNISEIAKEIVQAIRPPRKQTVQRFFGPLIQLKIADWTDHRHQRDFDGVSVASCNEEARRLFGLFKTPKTWGQLRQLIREPNNDSRWRDQLFDSIEMILAGDLPQPVQAVFKNPSGKMYRPEACAIDCLGNDEGPIECIHITFAEEVGALDFSAMPEKLSMLVPVLRFALRFRWEVLEQFAKRDLKEGDVERLESTFERIRSDWQSRGVGDQAAIERLFPQEKAERISQMYKAYREMRNEQGTGELDKAIRDKNVVTIPTILEKLLPASQEFLEMTTEQFAELISGGR